MDFLKAYRLKQKQKFKKHVVKKEQQLMEELTDKNNKTSPRESSNHFKRDPSKKRRSGKPKLNRDKKFKRSRSKR